jgi:hypothetical protein
VNFSRSHPLLRDVYREGQRHRDAYADKAVHSKPPENTSALSPDNPPPAISDSPGEELYVPTEVSPEAAFQAIGRLRKEAQDEIDRLLSFLDATDGDADFEPSLGFPELTPWGLEPGHPGGGDDREEDADHEDDEAFRDGDAVMGSRLNQDGRRRDNWSATFQAKELLIGKRKQVRARKAGRHATEGRTDAR